MERTLSVASRLTGLVRAGLIAGVAVAVIAYPLAALAGLGINAGTELLDKLPAIPDITAPPQTSYLYAADGRTLITSFYAEDRKYTKLADTSPWIQEAVIAAEDARFYEHHGVDLKGTIRAFVANNQAGTVSQGASTLTMQYVRNALRDAARTPQEAVDATEQTSGRKIREMKLAIELEKRMTKTQILEAYLNVAYFGHRAYGIYAAAEIYFSRTPATLTLEQAATLAGLVQAPSAYDPAGSDQSAALRRRNWVIDRMAELGYVSPPTAAAGKALPITLKLSSPPNDCVSVPARHNDYGWFCDEFKQWWMAQPAFGTSPGARLDRLRSGGYRIVTTLDPRIQASATRHVLRQTRIGSKFATGGVFLEPGTGRIRAMAVNRIYALDQSRNPLSTDPGKRRAHLKGNYPRTVNMLLGGGDTGGYQAGSTFKLFTMLAALENGYTLNTTIYAPQMLMTKYRTGHQDPSECGAEHWCPQNSSDGDTGYQTMWSGWGKSVNTYWVQVEERVGAAKAVRMAERLGLRWHTNIDRVQASPAHADSWGAFTLGVADTTPLEMAAAYATVAADGLYCQPLPVLSVTDPSGRPAMMTPDGTPIPVVTPRCHQAVSRGVARGALDAMRCTTGYEAATGPCGGWGTAPSTYPMVGRPFAGKTGTTDDQRSVWFIGFTPQLAGASFVADPDNPFDLAGGWQYHKPQNVVALTVHDAMRGVPVKHFIAPPASIVGQSHHYRRHSSSSSSSSSSSGSSGSNGHPNAHPDPHPDPHPDAHPNAHPGPRPGPHPVPTPKPGARPR